MAGLTGGLLVGALRAVFAASVGRSNATQACPARCGSRRQAGFESYPVRSTNVACGGLCASYFKFVAEELETVSPMAKVKGSTMKPVETRKIRKLLRVKGCRLR